MDSGAKLIASATFYPEHQPSMLHHHIALAAEIYLAPLVPAENGALKRSFQRYPFPESNYSFQNILTTEMGNMMSS